VPRFQQKNAKLAAKNEERLALNDELFNPSLAPNCRQVFGADDG
jgi:hypothetical protein